MPKILCVGLAVGAAVLLAGCGFRPLYGSAGPQMAVSTELRSIQIEQLNTLLGVELRNQLIDGLTPDGEPAAARYRLALDLADRRQELGVRIDASATRYNFILSATYSLVELASGNVVYTGSSASTVAYDVVDSQFATVYSRLDAESRAAQELSDEIRLRLALFFDSRPRDTAVLEQAAQPAP